MNIGTGTPVEGGGEGSKSKGGASSSTPVTPNGQQTTTPLFDWGALNRQINKDRQKYADRYKTPLAKIREYVKGNHDLKLTEDQKEILEGLLENPYSHNLCERILSDAAERIEFLGAECKNTVVNDWIQDWLMLAGMEEASTDLVHDCLQDRDICFALEWNVKSDRPDLIIEPWWDGSEGIFVKYNEAGRVFYVVKEWIVDDEKDIRRRNIWMQGLVARFIGTGKEAWDIFLLPEDNGRWPVPRLRRATNEPAHPPVIHFSNRGDGASFYGWSELDGGVIGGQDQVNDMQLDICAAARMTGYPILTASGVDFGIDEETKEDKQPVVGPGIWVWTKKEGAQFGSIPPGDLSQLINAKNEKVKDLSQMTATPFHVLQGGNPPSGEALYRAEKPAVDKAAKKIKRFRTKFIETIHRAIEMYNDYHLSGVTLDEDVKSAPITVRFTPPDRRDKLSLALIVSQTKDYISIEEGLRILGYNDTEIERIIGEKDAAFAKQQEQMIAAFDAGNPDESKSGNRELSNARSGSGQDSTRNA